MMADWPQCGGSWRNSVCVRSLLDLSTILQSGAHIVNKFRSDLHPFVGDCLAELVITRANSE